MTVKLHTALSALTLSLLLGDPSAALAQTYAAGPIRIGHPWTPPAAETARDAPGYLTITNTGSAPDRLVSGSFIEASHVQIHTAGDERGRATMTATDGLVINPGETVVLRPGGPHLMFVGLKSALTPGQSFQSILRFDRAGTALVEFAVEGPASRAKTTRRGAARPAETSAHAGGR